MFARLLQQPDGETPAPFWRPVNEPVDTRLVPQQPRTGRFTFPAQTEKIHVRLFYRRFWQQVARAKGWPDNQIDVVDEVYEVIER